MSWSETWLTNVLVDNAAPGLALTSEVLQAEHSQALKQEQSRLAALRADFEAQIKAAQGQTRELQASVRAHQASEKESRQAQAELQATNYSLQVRFVMHGTAKFHNAA